MKKLVRNIGERSQAALDLGAKLRTWEDELMGFVNNGKFSSCRGSDSKWKINQNGPMLNSKCLLYKSAIGEVSIWGWPLQTAGLFHTGFFSSSITVLSGRVTEEKITPEESSAIVSCHLKVLWTAGFASGVGGGLSWQVAKRLKMLKGLERLALAAGVATATFAVAWDRASSTTAVSCLDHILSQDATRMQKELVNVLVRSNRGEAWRWQLMSKHFYPEAVYGDEGDKPQMRWRRRTTFTEIASSYDDVNETKSQRNHNGLPNPPHRSISNGSDASKTKPMPHNSSGNSNGEMVEEDALDIVFGGPEPTESIPAPINSKVSGKTQTRKQKRAQRRQRLKNREASTNTPQYELA